MPAIPGVQTKLSAGCTVESLMSRTPRIAAPVALIAYSVAGYPADLSVYAVATSDYVHRGVTYSDSHAAGQLGIDANLDSGIYFGVWGSTTDIGGGTSHERDRQINYYAGYLFEASRHVAVGFNAVAYTFPASAGGLDYSYEEYAVSLGYDDSIWVEYGYSPNLYGTGRGARNFEVSAEIDAAHDSIIGGGVGYYDVSDLAGVGYGYWHIGISRAFGELDLDLRFHDTNRPVPFISSPERAAGRLSLSARLQF